jgi:hypothetical protein
VVDETVKRGGRVLRDIAGASPSELVRVVKPDLDSHTRRGTSPDAAPFLSSRVLDATHAHASLPTLAVHAGEPAHDSDAPVVTPLQQSVSFVHEVGDSDGLRYPGYGNTPNAEWCREARALERAEAGVVLSSGMGATACALMALLRPGDHLLAGRDIYGGTQRLLTEEFTALGIDVTLVDPFEARGWRKRMRKETRAVFLESPVNRRAGDRPAAAELPHARERAGPRRRLDVRQPDQFPAARARRRRRDPLHDQVLNGHHDVMGGVCSAPPRTSRKCGRR